MNSLTAVRKVRRYFRDCHSDRDRGFQVLTMKIDPAGFFEVTCNLAVGRYYVRVDQHSGRVTEVRKESRMYAWGRPWLLKDWPQ